MKHIGLHVRRYLFYPFLLIFHLSQFLFCLFFTLFFLDQLMDGFVYCHHGNELAYIINDIVYLTTSESQYSWH